MQILNDEFYMDLAIKKAWEFQILTYPNPSVGCVILGKNGEILSIAAHEKAGSFHAELNAIIKALLVLSPKFKQFFNNFQGKFSNQNLIEIYNFILQNHDGIFEEASAFVTLEPCNHFGKTPPCSNLIAKLGFKRVVVGIRDLNKIASGGIELLKSKKIEIKVGVCEEKCKELIEPFLKWQSGNFSFFKIAVSQNGVINGKISGENLQILNHKIRSKIDLLVVGGNTVRTDRPILDARKISGKNPDVFIYSNSQNFDKTIPLFGIANRKVEISNEISKIKEKNLVMIEGGENFLKNLPDFVEYFLIFHSDNFLDNENLRINLKLKSLYKGEICGENYSWYKKI